MDNFIAWLGVVFEYTVKLVGYALWFGAIFFIVVIGIVGMWGFLDSIWEEIKMEVHKWEN